MLYSVTIEAAMQSGSLPVVRATIEAADKDAALKQAEAAYRRMDPSASRLIMHVLRLRDATSEVSGAGAA